jgi:AcrR family transcriptional regulator
LSSALSERQSRRVQETKLRIVNAMRDFLSTAEKPDITVEQLCERADVARKTFYNHYENIAQLQMELVGEFVLRDYHSREQAVLKAPDFLGRFMHYIVRVIEQEPYHLDTYNRNILRLGFEAYFQQTAESAAMIHTVQHAFLVDWLQQEMDQWHWTMPFTASTFIEFSIGMQSGATVHTAYENTHDFRNDHFDAQDLMLRYFARKRLEYVS